MRLLSTPDSHQELGVLGFLLRAVGFTCGFFYVIVRLSIASDQVF